MDKKQVKNVDKIKEDKSQAHRNDEIARKNRNLKQLIKDSYMGAEYEGQIEGYVISDRFAFMRDKWGGYSYEDGKSLSSFYGLDMDNYGGSNDCTIVAITTISNWIADSKGYSSIPDSTLVCQH